VTGDPDPIAGLSTAAPSTAALSIVAGRPTPEEAAAVTVVLTAVASAAPAGTQPGGDGHRSAWSDRSRLLRPAVSAGPGAWRASALPA
jgi:Acyl-CoA carboxylase epsilon subunit